MTAFDNAGAPGYGLNGSDAALTRSAYGYSLDRLDKQSVSTLRLRYKKAASQRLFSLSTPYGAGFTTICPTEPRSAISSVWLE